MTRPRDDYHEITEVDIDSEDPNIRGIVGAIVAVALALLGLLAGIAVARVLRNRRTTPTAT